MWEEDLMNSLRKGGGGGNLINVSMLSPAWGLGNEKALLSQPFSYVLFSRMKGQKIEAEVSISPTLKIGPAIDVRRRRIG